MRCAEVPHAARSPNARLRCRSWPSWAAGRRAQRAFLHPRRIQRSGLPLQDEVTVAKRFQPTIKGSSRYMTDSTVVDLACERSQRPQMPNRQLVARPRSSRKAPEVEWRCTPWQVLPRWHRFDGRRKAVQPGPHARHPSAQPSKSSRAVRRSGGPEAQHLGMKVPWQTPQSRPSRAMVSSRSRSSAASVSTNAASAGRSTNSGRMVANGESMDATRFEGRGGLGADQAFSSGVDVCKELSG